MFNNYQKEKLMKKKLFFIALLLVFALVSCGGEEEDDWGNDGDGGNSGNNEGNGGWMSQEGQEEILQTMGFSFIHSLAIGSNDTLYVGGRTNSDASGTTDALIVAFDTKGKELWRKQWDFYKSNSDSVDKIVTDKQGNIYVMGGYGDALFIMKIAPDGTKIWEQFPEFDDLYSLTLDTAQNVYVSYRYEIVKYSADGKELQRYNISDDVQGGITGIYALTVDSKGNIYAGGNTEFSLFADNAGKTDAFLVKIAPDGTQLWGKQWGGERTDRVKTILLDDNDNIFVASAMNVSSNSVTNRTYLNLKLSQDGDKIWETDLRCDFAAMCNDDNIYCVGGNQFFKYNSKGESVGNYSTEYATEYGDHYLNQIICDNKQNIYGLAGSSEIIKIPASEIK